MTEEAPQSADSHAAAAFYDILNQTLARHDEKLDAIDTKVTTLGNTVESLRGVVNDQAHEMQAAIELKADQSAVDLKADKSFVEAQIVGKQDKLTPIIGRVFSTTWGRVLAVLTLAAAVATIVWDVVAIVRG